MTTVEKEIREQITDLPNILSFMKDFVKTGKLPDFLFDADLVYFVGCGSSHYNGIAASRYFIQKTGIEARALPGGEIFFAKNQNIGSNTMKRAAVLISRSGESTEVLLAGKVFKQLGIPTLGITTVNNSSLVKIVDRSIVLPLDEVSIVMTKSFSAILLALQLLVDYYSNGNFEYYDELVRLIPDIIEKSFEMIQNDQLCSYKRFIFLGIGSFEGIAREGALKLEEMSLSTTKAFSTYEFRHGPKSMADEETLVTIFGDITTEERKLADELRSYGSKIIYVGSGEPDIYTGGEMGLFLSPIFSQILGLKIAEAKGLNVEAPRNLTKVVRFVHNA